jgi:hypothetical protein
MESRLQVFISWSGTRSQKIAEALRDWLPLVIERPIFWLSSRDIAEGTRWAEELSEQLERSHFGILVLTPENVLSPWLLFEAGALSKSLKLGRVIPLLVEIETSALRGPLAQFQAATADSQGMLRIVRAINMAAQEGATDSILLRRFTAFWPELESKLGSVPSEPGTDSKTHPAASRGTADEDVLNGLKQQLAEMAEMMRQIVASWNPTDAVGIPAHVSAGENPEINTLKGAWVNVEGDSHIYIRVVNGQIVAPYCFGGNDELTAVYYDWKKVGDYWFARFMWFNETIQGFGFFRAESTNVLEGRWWGTDEDEIESSPVEVPVMPAATTGVHSRWERISLETPTWAEEFFTAFERQGLAMIKKHVRNGGGKASIEWRLAGRSGSSDHL